MKPAELSPEAHADLDEIWLHVAAESLEAADKLIDELRAKCDSLSVLPSAGRDRSDFFPGARTVPYGNYLILYRERAGWIEVLRIVHGMRDLPQLFREDA